MQGVTSCTLKLIKPRSNGSLGRHLWGVVRVGELGGDVEHELRIVVQDVVTNLRFIS